MKHSTARLGGVSKERPLAPARETNSNITVLPSVSHVEVCSDERTDFFIKKDGVEYAGTHLLIELWGASNLGDGEYVEDTLVHGANVAGATVLHSYMHPFGPDMGVSGVVVLAESHISIHTWPERDYAAVDIFMCGSCDPYKAVAVLKDAFTPSHVQLSEQKRGVVG